MVGLQRLELVTDYPTTSNKLVRVGFCDFVPTVALIDKKTTVYMDTEEWKFVADQAPRMLSLLQSKSRKVEVEDRVRCKNVSCIFSKKGRNRVMKIEQVVICFAMFNQSPSTLQPSSPSTCFNRMDTIKLCKGIEKINESINLITKMVELYKKNEEDHLTEPVESLLSSAPIDLSINTNTLFCNLNDLKKYVILPT